MNYLLELPLSLGIHGTYKGYRYLVFALELALSDENQLLYVTKNLYPSVARRYHTTPSCCHQPLLEFLRQNAPAEDCLLHAGQMSYRVRVS